MKRIICDLDGTLLHGDFSDEYILFRAALGEEGNIFFEKIWDSLNEYERMYPYYEKKLLAYFLSLKTGMRIDSSLIDAWIYTNSYMHDKIDEGTIELLETAKRKNIKISLLTNWFADTQIKRVERSKLLPYFDTIVCGDRCLKPTKESYLLACDGDDPRDCIMIGDNLEKDVLAPTKYGLTGIWYNQDDIVNENCIKVKKLTDAIKFY